MTKRREVARVAVAYELQRAYLPLEIYPISAGIKGGLAGSVAMAALAMLYGLVSQYSIWYPINLLAAGFMPAKKTETTAELAAFHLGVFLIAVPIHLITSLLVGLLYGAMLPMLPRRPVLLGGFIAHLMDRSDSQHSRHCKSGAESAHSLALVRALADGIRDCRRHCRFPSGAHSYLAASPVRPPRGPGRRDDARKP